MASRFRHIPSVLATLSIISVAQAEHRFGFGRPATEAEIAGWHIDVDRDGNKLPDGTGSVSLGHKIFDDKCAACHGAKGEGAIGDRLVGGRGTLASSKPLKTVGSFWPYAPTLFDYIRRAMPMNAPPSLSADEVYAVTAYILYLNEIVPKETVLNAEILRKVEMPNRNGFVADPRPDAR